MPGSRTSIFQVPASSWNTQSSRQLGRGWTATTMARPCAMVWAEASPRFRKCSVAPAHFFLSRAATPRHVSPGAPAVVVRMSGSVRGAGGVAAQRIALTRTSACVYSSRLSSPSSSGRAAKKLFHGTTACHRRGSARTCLRVGDSSPHGSASQSELGAGDRAAPLVRNAVEEPGVVCVDWPAQQWTQGRVHAVGSGKTECRAGALLDRRQRQRKHLTGEFAVVADTDLPVLLEASGVNPELPDHVQVCSCFSHVELPPEASLARRSAMRAIASRGSEPIEVGGADFR